MSSSLQRAQSLLSWFKERGGYLNPSLSIVLDPQYGLSIFATSPVEPDERLVSCPFELAITPDLAITAIYRICDIKETDLVWPAQSSKAGQRWNERMRIGAYICLHWVKVEDEGIIEHALPPDLVHWPYIASLPASTDLLIPLCYTEDELSLLNGTNLLGAVHDQRHEWEAEAEAIRNTLQVPGVSWDRYLMAATYLSSRAFPSRLLRVPTPGSPPAGPDRPTTEEESHPVLLPGVDLFNHARAQPILWLSSEPPSLTGSPIPSVSLVSTQSQTAGTQVFNNYGAKPNEELLLGYGFVLDPNPDDTVTLKLGAQSLPSHVIATLRSKKLDPAKRHLLRRDGDIPKDLLDIMRIIMSGGVDDPEPDEEDEHALHEHEERAVQLELDVLGMLGQMLEDKLEKLEEGDPGDDVEAREEVRRMCTVYRKGQRDVLQAGLNRLEERIGRLEKMLDQGMGGCSCCS